MSKTTNRNPDEKGVLQIRSYKGKPFFEARWRDADRAQRRRRLGPAWVTGDPESGWVPRAGRVRGKYLDERRAYRRMSQVIQDHEDQLLRNISDGAEDRPLFREVKDSWLVYLEMEKRAKPSTLAGYRKLLVDPGTSRDRRCGRIMREFGDQFADEITIKNARKFLSGLDREPISARTVNIHRQVLHAIYEFGRREDSFALDYNPFAKTTIRPEDGTKMIETFEPDEIPRVAAAARAGLHRRRSGYSNSAFSDDTEREWQRINDQDASLFVIAAFTGLRMGELRALRWKDVDLRIGALIVARSMSANRETSGTKSRRVRVVPLASQPRLEFERLRTRTHFTGREDFTFCRPDGGSLDGSGIRQRFIRTQEKAGLRVRRFHDLRHTFGTLAIRKFDVDAVREMMGHSSLVTTERYLHSKPRPDDAAKLSAVFGEGEQDHSFPLAD